MTALPWYVDGPYAMQHPESFWNCLITGILMMGVAGTALIWRRAYWPAWVFLALVVWTLMAPEPLGFARPEMTVARLILGGVGIAVSVLWIRRVLGRIPADRPVVKGRTFRECSSTERTLYGLILVVLGLGYCMALTYLYMTHEGLSGKPGLSVHDIAIGYYGNRSGTKLEAMLRGPMSGFRSQQDMDKIVAWLKSGAGESGYNKTIHPIIERDCARCHSAKSGMHLPDWNTYSGISKVAKVDTGMSLETLVELSHIHLFGIGLVAFVLGYVFTFAMLPAWFKNFVIVVPFVAMVIDIATWYLTKWDPIYAYTVVVAGAVLGLSWAIQIFVSLYQIVFLGKPEPQSAT
ncbi:conserved hypothetical protein, membrane [mine drainage metagenome]|uniref:Elongation factor-1 alpha n=2 Tax=mine drainage metagenome TaxID=410659 RepID=T0XU06_9ZZZZ